MILFFHGDLDGKCACAVALKKFPYARAVPMDYDIPFPVDMIEDGEAVVLLDFTPNKPEEFKKIIEKASEVVWIDHHGANISKYPEHKKELPGLRVQSEPSGAMLAWQYYFPDVPAPKAVALVSDHDCWLHKIPNSEAFFWGMYLVDQEPTSPVWNMLFGQAGDIGDAIGHPSEADNFISNCAAHGRTIMEFRKALCAEHLDRFGYHTEFEGLKAIACCTSEKGSGFFDSVLNDVDVVLSYCHDGEKFLFGLYSKNKDIDCAKLAQKHGGGGHKGAAGFSTKKLPFEKSEALRD